MSLSKNIKSYYDQAPPIGKTVMVVGGSALVLFAVYKLSKYFGDMATNKAGQAAAGDLSKLASQGVYPTYADSTFENFASQLVQAMNGCGTDENAIYQVYRQLRNDADLLRLTQIFGVRYYQPCEWTSPVSYAIWQFNDKAYGGDLPTWLGYDLSSGEIENINSILAQAGISIRY